MVSGKIPPGKKPLRKLPQRKLPPGKLTPENCPPSGKMPPKNCVTSFSLLLTLSYSCSFLSFLTVTSFRNVSGTPATSIMDPLVILLKSIN